MKKIFLIFSFCIWLFANEQKLLNIPAASNIYISFDEKICSDACLLKMLEDGLYISYLANFHSQHHQLKELYKQLLSGNEFIEIPTQLEASGIKIAIVIPEKVLKSYSSDIISPSIAYLLAQNIDAKIQVFFTHDESSEQIDKILPNLADFKLIITGFNSDAIRYFADRISDDVRVYNPLASGASFDDLGDNISFGKIDYEAQIDALLKMAAKNKFVLDYKNPLTNELSEMIGEKDKNATIIKVLGYHTNIAALLKDDMQLDASSIFFNTPLLKTTLFATQLRAEEYETKNYLSTQLNYHPRFLDLSQENEREKFYFANSIDVIPSNLEYYNDILGQKIAYKWIAFATSAGLDLHMHELFDTDRIFQNELQDKNLVYKVRIMNAKAAKFSEIYQK